MGGFERISVRECNSKLLVSKFWTNSLSFLKLDIE